MENVPPVLTPADQMTIAAQAAAPPSAPAVILAPMHNPEPQKPKRKQKAKPEKAPATGSPAYILAQPRPAVPPSSVFSTASTTGKLTLSRAF